MTLSNAIAELTHVLRRDRYSEKTLESYSGWVSRFFGWMKLEIRAGRTYQAADGVVDHEARVTALLQSGRPIQEVSQLLGHGSIETTQVYLHCLPRLEERLTSPLDAARNVTPMRWSA